MFIYVPTPNSNSNSNSDSWKDYKYPVNTKGKVLYRHVLKTGKIF